MAIKTMQLIINMALQTKQLIIHGYKNNAIDNTHGFTNNATVGEHRQTKFQLYTSKHQSLSLFDTFRHLRRRSANLTINGQLTGRKRIHWQKVRPLI